MEQITLVEIREKILKMTQQELATKLGMTIANYSQKERYIRELKASELLKISEIAKIDPRVIKI